MAIPIPSDYTHMDFPHRSEKRRCTHYAELCGFHGLAKHLLVKYLTHINALGGNHGVSLHAASLRNHPEVVRLLLEDGGGNVDVRDPENWTPLHTTSQRHRATASRARSSSERRAG